MKYQVFETSLKKNEDQAAVCFYFLNITIIEFSLNKAAGFNLPPFTKTVRFKRCLFYHTEPTFCGHKFILKQFITAPN